MVFSHCNAFGNVKFQFIRYSIFSCLFFHLYYIIMIIISYLYLLLLYLYSYTILFTFIYDIIIYIIIILCIYLSLLYLYSYTISFFYILLCMITINHIVIIINVIITFCFVITICFTSYIASLFLFYLHQFFLSFLLLPYSSLLSEIMQVIEKMNKSYVVFLFKNKSINSLFLSV